MKIFSKNVLIILGFVSSSVLAGEFVSPLVGVDIEEREANNLSVHNLSSETIVINIYGDVIELLPASGIVYECKGYSYLELQVQKNQHDYFEVACQSNVVFSESFKNQSVEG